ncbi:hypothetical protein NM688_g7863 [Phlebia brevispora]|uniref:Uncharacterized protein n=1 Tax=Phlebia brevispora TaxID=194682 RepID=A0ACC1S0H1_9APHY|nr:hypothetical protein NM688_g7863 [Phlebia brevispora]
MLSSLTLLPLTFIDLDSITFIPGSLLLNAEAEDEDEEVELELKEMVWKGRDRDKEKDYMERLYGTRMH